ncbi:MAG: AIPR family protein [Chloroflexota bacterium]|nr:AIPR family protein [Chloroflexota bacterium]
MKESDILKKRNENSKKALVRDRDVLTRLVKQSHAGAESKLCITKYFEIYVAEQILKDRKLSPEAVRTGIVGGGDDGGIDSLFLFADQELVDDCNSSNFLNRQNRVEIELVLIQSKFSHKSPLTAIQKLALNLPELLNLESQPESASNKYDVRIVNTLLRFQDLRTSLADKFPSVKIRIYYVTMGHLNAEDIEHPESQITGHIQNAIPMCDFNFQFLGASDFLRLIRKSPYLSLTISFENTLISNDDEGSYVMLVGLRQFYAFVSDENRDMRPYLYDSNVRAWQGDTRVNDQIRQSLDTLPVKDFWWLNNGVTIIASKVHNNGKSLTLENPSIVNGLQTTNAIHQYFSQCGMDESDNRRVLVRIFTVTEEDEEKSREHIIRATNSHNRVKKESLRALDEIHYEIETYLNTRDKPFFYERRDRYYANQHVPRDRIVSIKVLTQAFLATVLLRPDDAMGRPGDYLETSYDEKYSSVFTKNYDRELYHFCSQFHHNLVMLLRQANKFSDITFASRNRIRFHIMSHIVLQFLGLRRVQVSPPLTLLANKAVADISDACMLYSARRVVKLYTDMKIQSPRLSGKQFEAAVIADSDALLT